MMWEVSTANGQYGLSEGRNERGQGNAAGTRRGLANEEATSKEDVGEEGANDEGPNDQKASEQGAS